MQDRELLQKHLAENVRRLREERGWTQTELAKRVGVVFATINRIENEHHIPDWKFICDLADALGVTTDDLRKKPEKISA